MPQREADSRLETANIKQFLEEAKMWRDAQIAFTESEKDRKMEKSVRGKLMKL